jgi:hypothetical protein
MKHTLHILRIIMALLLFTSCEHKDLCLHHPHATRLKVAFDWSDAPEATPRGMCVYFYPIEGGSGSRFDFNGTEGGYVNLKVGRYRAICYNNDTESVLFHSTDSYTNHGAYTREGNVLEPLYGNTAQYAPRAKNTENERVVICPDMMWGSIIFDIEVLDNGVTYTCEPLYNSNGNNDTRGFVSNDEHIITFYPHEVVCTYTYEIRNVQNLKHVAQMSGTLSSMAGALTFSNEELGRECVTLPFESTLYDASTVTGQFYTFGHHLDNTLDHRMVFYVVMDDGAKYCFKDTENLNVTQQIHDAPNHRHVHLIIDGLELPQPIENGHGFKPSVDDWGVVEEDIIL